MIDIVVLLEIGDRKAFIRFEKHAMQIMKKYNGRLLSAFQPDRSLSTETKIEEVHILQFDTLNDFENYRKDEELKAITALRAQAITNTTLLISKEHIIYS